MGEPLALHPRRQGGEGRRGEGEEEEGAEGEDQGDRGPGEAKEDGGEGEQEGEEEGSAQDEAAEGQLRSPNIRCQPNFHKAPSLDPLGSISCTQLVKSKA